MAGARKDSGASYSAALYMRLSKDDEGAGESASISTQRRILRAYAQEHGFSVYAEYVDDGVSGTNFHRAGFQSMLRDIEAKKVNLVLTKDLSRLGRDYIQTGQYTELYFPSRKVRCIAINDGYDSETPNADIVPFKNILNEMYARDTSRKIRSAFAALMREGLFVGAFAPYGYRRDPLDKHRLAVDEQAAGTVRELYRWAAQGASPTEMARRLNERGIPAPLQYRYLNHFAPDEQTEFAQGRWSSSTISKMLRNPVYLGHMAQGKTTKLSFKSAAAVANPPEEWFFVPNTHPPLVSQELFDLAVRQSQRRTCPQKGVFQNLFSGIARCADCASGMSAVGTRKKGASANLACGRYKRYGSGACTNHFIDYNLLCDRVLSALREQMQLSRQARERLLLRAQRKLRQADGECGQKEAQRLKKRREHLELLIDRVYEDSVQGLLSTERARQMIRRYEAERARIAARLGSFENRRVECPEGDLYERLKEMLNEILDPDELSSELLRLLVDRVEIEQGRYQKTEHGRRKIQTIRIFFRFREQEGKNGPP